VHVYTVKEYFRNNYVVVFISLISIGYLKAKYPIFSSIVPADRRDIELLKGFGIYAVENPKICLNMTLPCGMTLSPEVIFTNNFRNIFPGITVKVF
jgi:hypothetical protein